MKDELRQAAVDRFKRNDGENEEIEGGEDDREVDGLCRRKEALFHDTGHCVGASVKRRLTRRESGVKRRNAARGG